MGSPVSDDGRGLKQMVVIPGPANDGVRPSAMTVYNHKRLHSTLGYVSR